MHNGSEMLYILSFGSDEWRFNRRMSGSSERENTERVGDCVSLDAMELADEYVNDGKGSLQ